MATKTALPLPLLRIRDLSGGLNLRDAQNELGPTESPDAWNVTLDERGGVAKRRGYAKWNTDAFNSSLVIQTYYWQSGAALFSQAGTDLFKDTSNSAVHTFSTDDRVGFADYGGKVWAIHPIDGLYYSSDGTSFTLAPAGPLGSTLAAWQGRLWASGLASRVYFTEAGDGTIWFPGQTTTTGSNTLGAGPFVLNVTDTSTFDSSGAITVDKTQTVAYTGKTGTTFTGCTGGTGTFSAGTLVTQDSNYVDLDEKDSDPVICLTGAAGVDIAGRPGLLAFKRRSTYRINDSATGAYQTIDTSVGAASALAVESYLNETIVVSERGVFVTDGVTALKAVGQREEPLWTDTQINYAHLDLVAAGRVGDRIKFSMPRVSSTHNDLAFEYHPAQGWLVPGSNAMACYTTYGSNAEKLLGGHPTTVGRVYQLDTGGSDDGSDIESWFQTKFFEPADGILCRMRRVRVTGRGDFSLYQRFDYDLANDQVLEVSIDTNLGAVYDDPGAVYDLEGVVYGPTKSQDYEDFYSVGCCKAVAFRVEETSSDVTSAPLILSGGAAPEVGAWALYGIDVTYIPLGLA